MLWAGDDCHVMPQAMNILGGSPGERGTAITFESPVADGADAAPQKRPFLAECVIVNLAADSRQKL
jgi:hypothetical protein